MKKFISLFSLLMMVLFVTSCNKLPEINELYGVYKGSVDVEENNMDKAKNIPATAVLSAGTEDGKISIEITMPKVETFPAEKVTLTCTQFLSSDKDEYVLNGTGTVHHVNYGSFSVSVVGELDKKELDLVLTGSVNGMPIEIEFDGRK